MYNQASIGAGWAWSQLYPQNPNYFPYVSLGLQYQYTNLNNKKTLVDFNGYATDLGNKVNFDYFGNTNYIFSQISLLGNLKIDLYRWRYVMPYINLGLGVSSNRTKQNKNFYIQETAVVFRPEFFEIVTPNKRNVAFSYNVGLGLDFPIKNNFWLSLGYVYNDLGKFEISKGRALPSYGINFYEEQADERSRLLRPFKLHFSSQNIQLTARYLFS